MLVMYLNHQKKKKMSNAKQGESSILYYKRESMNKYIFREKINLLVQILLTILLSCFMSVAIVFTKRLFEVQNKTFSLIVISASLILFAGINYLKDRTIYNMGLSFVEGFKQDLFHNVISQNFYEIQQKEKTFSNDITSTSPTLALSKISFCSFV